MSIFKKSLLAGAAFAVFSLVLGLACSQAFASGAAINVVPSAGPNPFNVVPQANPLSPPPTEAPEVKLNEAAAAYNRGDYPTAFLLVQPLAEQGNAFAQSWLGFLYELGHGVPQDYGEAVKWYRLAAAQGNADAQNNLGRAYESGHGVAQDYGEAVKWYRLAAAQGIAYAQNRLGYAHEFGLGVPQDYGEAVKWYRLAAAQGNAEAQASLGFAYGSAHGVPQDYGEAIKWFRLAAAQGNAVARSNLGVTYDRGDGVPQNYGEAVKWYRLAAVQGGAEAQTSLGYAYWNGLGVPQNYGEAVKWYRLAAAQGNAGAQNDLGYAYDHARGVPQNYGEAVKWYRLAAAQGEAEAQTSLGYAYWNGHGVPQNYGEAVKWYRLAAAQGNAGAQNDLGYAYWTGRGVPQDFVQAHMWFNLASSNTPDPQLRDSAAANRDRLASQMTQAQIAAAQKLANEWRPSVPVQQAAVSPPPQPTKPHEPDYVLSGSGLFISENGDVLTNAHVVEACETATVVTAQGAVIVAPIIARDAQIDLAVLKVSQPSLGAAQLRLTVRQGENIFAYGFPLAGLLSSGGNFTAGTVTALSGVHDDIRILQISAPVQPGNSGGPLLDEAGNVVGVVVSKLNALKMARATDDIPQNVNFAIKATAVADFLDAHGVRYAEGKLGPRLSPSDVAERARAFSVHIECAQEAAIDNAPN